MKPPTKNVGSDSALGSSGLGGKVTAVEEGKYFSLPSVDKMFEGVEFDVVNIRGEATPGPRKITIDFPNFPESTGSRRGRPPKNPQEHPGEVERTVYGPCSFVVLGKLRGFSQQKNPSMGEIEINLTLSKVVTSQGIGVLTLKLRFFVGFSYLPEIKIHWVEGGSYLAISMEGPEGTEEKVELEMQDDQRLTPPSPFPIPLPLLIEQGELFLKWVIWALSLLFYNPYWGRIPPYLQTHLKSEFEKVGFFPNSPETASRVPSS